MTARAQLAPTLVTGSIATDFLMHFPGKFRDQFVVEQLDRLSLSFLVDELVIHNGGNGANIAFGLGALGGNPVLVGAVGNDFAEYRAWLERHGVNCDHVLVSKTAHTARFLSTADDEKCQIATFYAGAMAEAKEIELAPIVERVGEPNAVVIGPNDPDAMVRHTQECRKHGYPFVADPSQQVARLDGEQVRELIDGASYLLSNDYEFGLILRKTGWTEAEIGERVGTRVTTLGEKGVEILRAGQPTVRVGAVPAGEMKDPTGIGDAFRSGFFAAVSGGLSLERAAQVGALVGVLALEVDGPQEWTLDADTALPRLREAYGAEAAEELGAFLPR